MTWRAASACCASSRRFRAATIPPPTWCAGCSPRPPTTSRCRSRFCTARACRSTVRRRCFWKATAPTASDFDAEFDSNLFSLVDRGFVYAIAHVRGGLEKGKRWHDGGRRENKVNTFTDFIAVAEYLIKAGYGAPGRIVARGDSAGGTLMGAVANMRPDLFAGIVARVPFVDVLNTLLDESLPLTVSDLPEWGDPARDLSAYRTIAGYSPYDNVKAQAYPPMLVTAGLSDPRVQYWEPAKWVAKLRAMKTNDVPHRAGHAHVGGHFGAAGRFEALDEVAMIQAFALDAVGGGNAPPHCRPHTAAAGARTDALSARGRRRSSATPTARLSPTWPVTDSGCSATVRFEPPTSTLAPSPAATVASAVAPT